MSCGRLEGRLGAAASAGAATVSVRRLEPRDGTVCTGFAEEKLLLLPWQASPTVKSHPRTHTVMTTVSTYLFFLNKYDEVTECRISDG